MCDSFDLEMWAWMGCRGELSDLLVHGELGQRRHLSLMLPYPDRSANLIDKQLHYALQDNEPH